MNLLNGAIGPLPVQYRRNAFHLIMDITWFGVLSSSAISFVTVYATRLGASTFEVGLLSAGTAAVNLAFTLPTGHWLQKQPIGTATFWASVFHRAFYLLWIPLPMLLAPPAQVWALILLTLLMTIPGTALTIGFNSLFAEAIPAEWRGHVAGIRNAVSATTFIGASLVSGFVLDRVPFPLGYQIVFGLGCLGAAMSSLHLWFVVPFPDGASQSRRGHRLRDLTWTGPGVWLRRVRSGINLRTLVRARRPGVSKAEILHTPFGHFLGIVFVFHLGLYLAIPLFPIHMVNNLHLSDQEIGLGSALFYAFVFLGSTQFARLVRRLGNQRVAGIGALFISQYAGLMAPAAGLGLYLAASVMGGLGWSLWSGALINFLLEKAPADRRPTYMAWYNLEMNAGLLVGALLGPLVAGFIGVRLALGIFSAVRLLAGLGILLWKWPGEGRRAGND